MAKYTNDNQRKQARRFNSALRRMRKAAETKTSMQALVSALQSAEDTACNAVWLGEFGEASEAMYSELSEVKAAAFKAFEDAQRNRSARALLRVEVECELAREDKRSAAQRAYDAELAVARARWGA